MVNVSVVLSSPNSANATRTLHSMHRVPFWLATEDGSNLQRAVVLYVQVLQTPSADMSFFPVMPLPNGNARTMQSSMHVL